MKAGRLTPPPRGSGTGDLFAEPPKEAPACAPDPARCLNKLCGAPWGCDRKGCQIAEPPGRKKP